MGNFTCSSFMRLLRLIQLAQEKSRSVDSLVNQIQTQIEDPKQLSRRHFLGGAAATALIAHRVGLPGISPLISSAKAQIRSTQSPVIILGAGVSGLLTAYRLHQSGIPCEIYEASSRVGGRMFTQYQFNEDGMFCELGGEAVDRSHEALHALCRELGVGIQDCAAEDAGLEKEVYWASGRLLSFSQMVHALTPFAAQLRQDIHALWGEKAPRIPTFRDQNHPGIVKLDQMSLAEYLQSKKELEPWMRGLIGSLYECEYGLDLSEQSALNFLTLATVDRKNQLSLLGPSDEQFRIQGGSSQLIRALEQRLKGQVPIHLGHRLLKIQNLKPGFKLSFSGETALEIKAQQVVCTLPFSILRGIEGIQALGLPPSMTQAIFELGYGSMAKWSLGFQRRLWRQAPKNASNGRILTLDQQQFWESSRMQKGSRGILARFIGGSRAHLLSDIRLQDNLNTLDQIYPGLKSLYEGRQFIMHWNQYPWAKGCYSAFKPGQTTRFNGLAARPQLGGRLFFAGEHVSVEFGGFMNGAIESAENCARSIAQGQKIAPNGSG
ncbi:MAG: flavin monoamine oxidase family protein [Bdellovibrionia bacterium]